MQNKNQKYIITIGKSGRFQPAQKKWRKAKGKSCKITLVDEKMLEKEILEATGENDTCNGREKLITCINKLSIIYQPVIKSTTETEIKTPEEGRQNEKPKVDL